MRVPSAASRWTSASLLFAFGGCLPVILAGCGGKTAGRAVPVLSEPSTNVLPDAVLAEVSAGESFLAYYTHPQRLDAGPYSGSLKVRALPSGQPIALGDGAFDANFRASGDTLYFLQDPAMETSGGSYTGHLSLWTPRLTTAVQISSGYIPHSATTSDHTATIYLDTPTADAATAGDVKLLRTAECAGTTCPVQTLATNVVVDATRISLDGRYAVFDVKTSSSGARGRDVYLVTVADGTTTRVASTEIPSQVVFGQQYSDLAPDGSLLAVITTSLGVANQLQVLSTATGAPVAWASLPAGSFCTGVKFADPATLLVETLDPSGRQEILRTTASGTSSLGGGTQMFVPAATSGGGRYVFLSTTPSASLAANAPYDLELLDLTSTEPLPVQVSQATRSTPQVSPDSTSAWLIEGLDSATGTGALVSLSLPSGRRTEVAGAVDVGSVGYGGSGNRLFYGGPASLPSDVPNGAGGPLYVFLGGESEQVAADFLRWNTPAGAETLYVSRDEPVGIVSEGIP